MRLTKEERQTLQGEHGEAKRLALSILTELGELFDATEMIEVSQAHLDSSLYILDVGLEFAEHLAKLKAQVAVPTSLNVGAIDLQRWRRYRVPDELLNKCRRLEGALLAFGATPTWTCAPYQHGLVPRFGEHIAWAESNAIAFANSIIGARTNRHADLIDICAAITGKAPKFGLHLTENRKAEILIRLRNVSSDMLIDKAIYPLLGLLVGEIAGDRVPAIEGIPLNITIDSLKALSAAAACAGAVGLFHVVGVTPEAQTLEICLYAKKPKKVVEITPSMIRKTEERLWTTQKGKADLIAIGCPHYSFMEFRELVHLLEGKKVHSSVTFWIFTSRTVYDWIKNCGILKELEASGAMVFTDTCALFYPKGKWKFSVAMTNSAKLASLFFSQTGLEVAYGSLEECVDSAVRGNICRRILPWRK